MATTALHSGKRGAARQTNDGHAPHTGTGPRGVGAGVGQLVKGWASSDATHTSHFIPCSRSSPIALVTAASSAADADGPAWSSNHCSAVAPSCQAAQDQHR